MTAAAQGALQAELQVQIGDVTWTLSAGRSAFWRERRWLVVADVHFGKAATFRALGVPVPHGTTSDTLSRLADLIDRMQPTTVVFLGDLFHAREAHAVRTLAALHQWRERYAALDLVLVEGNHDRKAGAPPASLRIHRESDPWRVDTLRFVTTRVLCRTPQRSLGTCILRFAFTVELTPASGCRASGCGMG